MKQEVKALEDDHTWEVVYMPPDKNIIGSKWVYKVKYKANGEIERFKARSVIALAVSQRLNMYQMDVYIAFLQGAVVSPSCVLPLNEENVEKVLEQVWPGLIADGGNVVLHEIDGLVVILKLQGSWGSCPSAGGGELELVQINNCIVKVRLSGLAASVMTLCVALTQKLRDTVPTIVADQLTD
ncbi:hypothetical protein CQW23_27773 [Capsicum baccatum]|uniref:NIF system FeS cluster assembly NifU C-terminal domain-containing protein n=1 Tax=Capsicum baccatum TaxID=33114 RepID=A0A2G2VEP7_CAPBA|nr:hypothetical protein CQW23_27773 [Capsicum baccatum]